MTIHNLIPDPLQFLLNAMRESEEYDFYLTGSRYAFRHLNPSIFRRRYSSSDWDFFAQDSPEIRKFLSDLGLVEITKGSSEFQTASPEKGIGAHYSSPDLIALFHLDGALEEDSVHIQLVKDVNQKLLMQEILENMGWSAVYRAGKKERSLLWTAVYFATVPRIAKKIVASGLLEEVGDGGGDSESGWHPKLHDEVTPSLTYLDNVRRAQQQSKEYPL